MATQIARKYVTQWGLSDAIGPVLVGDNEQEVFLGNQIMSRREVSEETHRLVDSEVKRVIDSAYQLATRVLSENIELLHSVAAMLLERETLTREDIEVLRRGDRLPPRPPPPPIQATPSTVPLPHQPKPSAPPLIGGPEPSPA
jgi:cell division protease FtsH